MSARSRTRDGASRRRTQGWWALCVAALLFTVAVGLWQAEPIQRFRNPAVDQTLAPGQSTTVEGVAFQLSSFTHREKLPVRASMRDSYPDGFVHGLPGAELVQVVLTLERIDPGVDPERIYCDVTLVDQQGRSWARDDVEYLVAGPEAITCTGGGEQPPALRTPYEVGAVFQVPADAVDDLRIRVRLAGGPSRQLLELRPG